MAAAGAGAASATSAAPTRRVRIQGRVADPSGQWIVPSQERLAALARQLRVETFPTYSDGENVIEYRGRLRRYQGAIPRINPVVLVDVEQVQRRLNRVAGARLFGPRASRPEVYVEKLWAEEEYTRGCYGCHVPTGAWTSYGRAMRPPIGQLHWAGAEYATVWNGYMDGAVRSGEAAAHELLAAI